MDKPAEVSHAALALARRETEKQARIRLKLQFTKELAIFTGCVIGALTVFRILRLLVSRFVKPTSRTAASKSEKPDIEGQASPAVLHPASPRRLPSAFAALFRNVFFRTGIPFNPCASVAELTFIVGYIIGNLIWLFIDTLSLKRTFYQDRAAHLGAVQLSLVVALSGKNNIISFLTGVSHEKLHVLHRLAARTSVFMLWTHAISRTATGLKDDLDLTHGWMHAGVVALVSLSLVVGFSIRPIRNLAFEFFFLSHVVLLLIGLVSAIIHTKVRHLSSYIWPALILWGFDRVLRLARVLFNNWSRSFKKAEPSHSNASVELLGRDTIRLTLRRRFSWKAGQHAYVILPSVSGMPTEAHPFTIASLPNNRDGEDNDLVFLIRVRHGFTARLKKLVEASSVGPTIVPAFVDGPYGLPPDPSAASTCVLIAGGSGVSFVLPLLQLAIREAVSERSVVKRAVFIWAVRDAAHVAWISKTLHSSLANVPSSLVVDVRVYVTGAGSEIPMVDYGTGSSTPTPEATPEGEKTTIIEASEISHKAPAYDFVKVERGRPDVAAILRKEMELARGHVQVNVAGPAPLTRAVKVALRGIATPNAVLRGMPGVTLNVESFGMVSK